MIPRVDNSGKHYTWETYPERLQKAGISWQVYQQDDDYGDNCIENLINILARLGRDFDNIRLIASEKIDHFFGHAWYVSRR